MVYLMTHREVPCGVPRRIGGHFVHGSTRHFLLNFCCDGYTWHGPRYILCGGVSHGISPMQGSMVRSHLSGMPWPMGCASGGVYHRTPHGTPPELSHGDFRVYTMAFPVTCVLGHSQGRIRGYPSLIGHTRGEPISYSMPTQHTMAYNMSGTIAYPMILWSIPLIVDDVEYPIARAMAYAMDAMARRTRPPFPWRIPWGLLVNPVKSPWFGLKLLWVPRWMPWFSRSSIDNMVTPWCFSWCVPWHVV